MYTRVLFWRNGRWLIGQVFLSKGKRLFTDGGFPVGGKSRYVILPDLPEVAP
jgi:hypothetical protein